jgi:hypothetical protein
MSNTGKLILIIIIIGAIFWFAGSGDRACKSAVEQDLAKHPLKDSFKIVRTKKIDGDCWFEHELLFEGERLGVTVTNWDGDYDLIYYTNEPGHCSEIDYPLDACYEDYSEFKKHADEIF